MRKYFAEMKTSSLKVYTTISMDDERERQQAERQQEERRQEEAERKEKERKERNMTIRIGVGMALSLITRQQTVDDPATRSMMFVDKLLMIMDGTMPFLNSLRYRYDLPTDIVSSMEKVHKQIREEVNRLMQWVQNPHYGPDHPYGKHLMQRAKSDFESKTQHTQIPPS